MSVATSIRLELNDEQRAAVAETMKVLGLATAKKAVLAALADYPALRRQRAETLAERDRLRSELEKVRQQRDRLRGDWRDALGLDGEGDNVVP